MANELSPAKKAAIALLAAGTPVKDVADEIGVTRKCLHDWKTKDVEYRIALYEAGAMVTGAAYSAFSGRMVALAEKVASRYEEMINERFDSLPGQVQRAILHDYTEWIKVAADIPKVNKTLNVNQTVEWKTAGTEPEPVEADVVSNEPVDDAE